MIDDYLMSGHYNAEMYNYALNAYQEALRDQMINDGAADSEIVEALRKAHWAGCKE